MPLTLFDVYWVKSNGKKLKVHNRASFLNEVKIQKLKKHPEVFEYEWELNLAWLEEGLSFFAKLNDLNEQMPPDLILIDEWRVDFINWATPGLWYGDIEDIKFLDFVSLISIGLESSEEDFYEGFDQLSDEVQSRNISIASTICFFALMMGYCDLKLLKDLYRTFLYLDYIYVLSDWSVEQERVIKKKTLEGVDSLTGSERDSIQEAYSSACERAISELNTKLENKAMGNYLRWALEDFEGSGLNLKVSMNEMSDLDLLVVLVLTAMKYEEGLLNKKVEQLLNEVVVGEDNLSDRLRKVITSSIQVASKRNNNFMKIAGL